MFATDLIEICGQKENFSEVASITFCNAEIAKKDFGDIVLAESEHIAYFPFKLCHSMPKINKRGRAFMPKVLSNSFASALDQLIDIEHLIKSNNISKTDQITGFIKAIKFDGIAAEIASETLTKIPTKPLPVKGLGALFLRADGAKDIVAEHNKHKNWRVSMECAHDWEKAYFYYRDNFIPITEAEKGMIECIQQGKVKQFKGHDLVVCLGGLDHKVDFWGAAVTRTPADGDADIEGNIFSLVSGISKDVASTKTFYMPLREYSVPKKDFTEEKFALEIASKIEEIASIEILGQTDVAPDGHFHYILTDLTVLPANGHDHYSTKFSITPGTNPILTGVTDSHSCYSRNQSTGMEERSIHAHTVKLSLKKKFKIDKIPADAEDSKTELDSEDTTESMVEMNKYTVQEGINMTKELLKLTQETNAAVVKLIAAKTDEERTKIGQEIASSNEKIAHLASKEVAEEEIKAAVDEKVKSGELLTKEQAEKLVADKQAEIEAKAKAEQEQKDKENARLELIKTSKINPDYLVGEVKASDFLAGIPFDENGEKTFKTQVSLLAKIPDAVLVTNQEVKAEAANTGNTSSNPSFAAKIKALAGGGTTSTEEANEKPKNTATKTKVSTGRSVFSKV